MNDRDSAKYRAFRAVPETCPAVDKAAETLLRDITHAIRDATDLVEDRATMRSIEKEIRSAIDDAIEVVKAKGTELLRKALIDAYERIGELEAENTMMVFPETDEVQS